MDFMVARFVLLMDIATELDIFKNAIMPSGQKSLSADARVPETASLWAAESTTHRGKILRLWSTNSGPEVLSPSGVHSRAARPGARCALCG